MKKTLLKSLALAAMGSLFVAGTAMAVPMLKVSATGAAEDIYMADGMSDGATYAGYNINADDDASAPGIVSGSGELGNFIYAFTTAFTKPSLGNASVPEMHLAGGASAGNNGGTFTVTFSETDFGPMAGGLTGFLTHLGATGGTQSLQAYYDEGNSLFATTTQIADLSTSTSQALDDIYSGIPTSNPFSITMVATITMGAGQAASFDNTVAPVPEPATMLLFGTGLAGLAGLRRRKAKKA